MDKYRFLKHISNVSRVLVFYKDNKESFLFSNGHIVSDHSSINNDLSFFDNFSSKNKAYIIKLDLKKCIIKINGEDFTIYLGPFALDHSVNYYYDVDYPNLFKEEQPVKIEQSTLIRIIDFIIDYFSIPNLTRTDVYKENFVDSSMDSQMAKNTDNALIQYLDEGLTHKSFDQVSRLEDCVKSGNLSMVDDVYNENIVVFTGGKEIDLEVSKYYTFSGLTIITRAAIKGGVNYVLAYQLSDTYLKKIIAVKNTKELNELYYQCIYQFTKLSFAFKTQKSEKETHSSYYVTKAEEYINEHISSPITVVDIANKLKITPNYLSAIFKKDTGITISEYIDNTKITIAKKMLNYSSFTLADIAFNLGYTSQSHFGKKFKDVTGMTPKQYINNLDIDENNEFKMVKQNTKNVS